MLKCYITRCIMPIDYQSYINPKLYLVVALCSTLNHRPQGEVQNAGVTDYNLLCDWLMDSTDVDTKVDSKMTTMSVQYWTYIDFTLAHRLKCTRAYVQMHLTYYQFTNIKEYFHEYQLLKATFALS